MTHYCVVVLDSGKNVAKLIEKYDEQISVPAYKTGDVTPEEQERFLNHYRAAPENVGKEEEFNKKSFEEIYEEYGERWCGKSWRKNDSGIWEEWSTYNPLSKYDYYSIIGHELPDFVPFAFVTPDGEWHSKGVMGWWAMSWDEKPDDVWEKEYRDALANYKGKYTKLDCHI